MVIAKSNSIIDIYRPVRWSMTIAIKRFFVFSMRWVHETIAPRAWDYEKMNGSSNCLKELITICINKAGLIFFIYIFINSDRVRCCYKGHPGKLHERELSSRMLLLVGHLFFFKKNMGTDDTLFAQWPNGGMIPISFLAVLFLE
jgi:hypothetical protein